MHKIDAISGAEAPLLKLKRCEDRQQCNSRRLNDQGVLFVCLSFLVTGPKAVQAMHLGTRSLFGRKQAESGPIF